LSWCSAWIHPTSASVPPDGIDPGTLVVVICPRCGTINPAERERCSRCRGQLSAPPPQSMVEEVPAPRKAATALVSPAGLTQTPAPSAGPAPETAAIAAGGDPPAAKDPIPATLPAPAPKDPDPRGPDPVPVSGPAGWPPPPAPWTPSSDWSPPTSSTAGTSLVRRGGRWRGLPPTPTDEQWSGPVNPPTYFRLALLCTVLFFWPLGLVALYNSVQVSRRLRAGDQEGAIRASRLARAWSWTSFAVGLLLLLLIAAGFIHVPHL
jgi:hypothetical protein